MKNADMIFRLFPVIPFFTLLLLLLNCMPGLATEIHSLYAGKISEPLIRQAIRGSSAIAGRGDWMLSNGTLCASISDPSHETYLSYRGGTLVDLGFCGRNDDQWNTYHELFNLSRENILPSETITTQLTNHEASIMVSGKVSGVENRTTYKLDLEHPDELAIETILTRIAPSEKFDLFGALILHPHRSLTPFVIDTHAPEYSKGFHHPYADHNNKLGMMKIMTPADLHVLVGSATITPEISYGVLSESIALVTAAGKHTPLRQFALNDQEYTLIGNFTNPLWFDTDGKPGLLQFLQTRMMDLSLGDSLVTKKRILVSKTADVASITNRIYTGRWLHGKISSPDDRLLVTDAEHHPLSFIKPEMDGSFHFRAPEKISNILLIVQQQGKDHALETTVDLDTTSTVSIQSPTQTFATLQLPAGQIMRLVFKGVNNTPDPVFFADKLDFRVGEKRFENDITHNSIALAGIKSDIGQVMIPAGDYVVYATHGPEFSLTRKTLHLRAGDKQLLVIDAPRRVLNSDHWISADFHVHSEFSFDSTLPAQRRVIDFIAQGGEVMVSTEHKRTVDYAPIIKTLGAQNLISSITGVELTGMAHTHVTPSTIGHENVFPVTAHEYEFSGGTLPHENRRLGEVITAYKSVDPAVVFQLNHPRYHPDHADEINFLDHLSIAKPFHPELPLSAPENASLLEQHGHSRYRDIDFDAIELFNGSDMKVYRLVREDWLSLLKQGYRKTATANSDSHNTRDVVAMPRNYVHVQYDAISQFSKQELINAVRHGDVFGTTGPLLDVTLNGKNMGDILSGKQATLIVNISAADWIPVDKLAVYVNGTLIKEQAVSRKQHYEMPLFFDKDSFVTVEVSGASHGDYATVYPGFTPFAYSNPIFVDADSDGKWIAPGL